MTSAEAVIEGRCGGSHLSGAHPSFYMAQSGMCFEREKLPSCEPITRLEAVTMNWTATRMWSEAIPC
jgi:hypothetical protein